MTTESLPFLWDGIASTFTNYSRKSTASLIKRLHTTPDLLTHTLPQLGKCVDSSLASGLIIIPNGLFRLKKGWVTPVFLHEYFSYLYDREGYLKENANPVLIRELRTLLYMFYKLESPFSPEQVVEATQKFIETDSRVKNTFTDEQVDRIKEEFQACLPKDPFDIRPHHSNGATADHLNNVMKLHTTRYIQKLSTVYGPKYFFNTAEHARMNRTAGQFIKANPTARVAFVPKDSRGPRTICMEPHEIMFIQKGIQQKIYDFIETPGNPGFGRINFTNQKINQHLAYLGSLDGSLATIDMKDASDMVPWELIQRVCDADWLVALRATRSAIVTLPDGTTRELYKYAPMGSALCFPIEAILFFCIARTITKRVWVYGDDIIVPTEHATKVIEALQEYGLVINVDKSLFTGFFRESCGGDFYRGVNITPLRFKKLDLVSVVALANNFAEVFSEESGLRIIEWYESINHEIILRLSNANKIATPHGVVTLCPLIAFFGSRDNSVLFRRKWNKDLQRYEIRSLTVVTRPIDSNSFMSSGTTEYNEFFYWLTNSESCSDPMDRDLTQELLSDIIPYQNYSVGFAGSLSQRIKLSKPKVCYRWAGYIPVS